MDRPQPANPRAPAPATAAGRAATVAPRLAVSLAVLIAASVLALLCASPVTGFGSTYTATLARPQPRMVALLAAFVAIASLGGGPRRWLWRLVASGCLAATWSSFRVLTMGDGHWWRTATRDGVVGYSEPLSSLAYALVAGAFGIGAIEWVAPVAGTAATLAWLIVTDRMVRDEPGNAHRVARCGAALAWTSCGAGALFFHRYVEHTQLGIAALILGLGELARSLRTTAPDVVGPDDAARPAAPPLRALLPGFALLGLAALSHLTFAPAVGAALVALVVMVSPFGPRRIACDLLAIASVGAALVAATCAAFALAPVQFVVGSVAGGADGQWLAPQPFARAHVALVTQVVVFGAPTLVVFAAAAPWWWRPRAHLAAALPALAATAAWLAFVATIGFDLGWPNDADLMVAQAPVAALMAFTLALPALAAGSPWTRALLLALGLAASASTWSAIAALVRPLEANLSARNSPRAALHVDGVDDGDGQGPIRVPIEPGQRVTLRAEGPAGVAFVVGRGCQRPACEGHPYGGVLDIEVSNAIQPDELVFGGVFDATGAASASWTVSPLPDGSLPGIQMLVFAPAAGSTSAAFYFVRHQ